MFCKALQGSARFCKVLQGPTRLCKVLQGPARSCKVPQGPARLCKILQCPVSSSKALQCPARGGNVLQGPEKRNNINDLIGIPMNKSFKKVVDIRFCEALRTIWHLQTFQCIIFSNKTVKRLFLRTQKTTVSDFDRLLSENSANHILWTAAVNNSIFLAKLMCPFLFFWENDSAKYQKNEL